MKALKILGAVLGLLILAAGVTFAVGIPGGFITGTIEDRVEKQTGFQLDINGGATIKLWPLTVVTLSDVALYDPKDSNVSERFRAEPELHDRTSKSPTAHAMARSDDVTSLRL